MTTEVEFLYSADRRAASCCTRAECASVALHTRQQYLYVTPSSAAGVSCKGYVTGRWIRVAKFSRDGVVSIQRASNDMTIPTGTVVACYDTPACYEQRRRVM